MIGESPTRPGIFHAKPLVVVTPDISPFSFSDRQLIVPYVGCSALSHAHASSSSLACGNAARSSCRRSFLAVRFWSIEIQLLKALGFRRDCFHTSQARRDFSVSRSSS